MLVMLIASKPVRCYSLVYQGQLQFAALSQSRIKIESIPWKRDRE